MNRFDRCVCGTTTTGTGTLSLVTTPVPPGGVDPNVWARAYGYGNLAVLPIDYVIVEYTDTTFTTEIQAEEGIGLLTLGGVGTGIAAATLQRTQIDSTATSLNSQPAAVNLAPASGISIGTAAHVLVMVTPRVRSLAAALDAPLASLTNGKGLPTIAAAYNISPQTIASGTIYYCAVFNPTPRKVSTITTRVLTAYSGGTSNLYLGLYSLDPVNGGPGRLVADFGVAGTANSSLAAAADISTAALATPRRLMPGYFILAVQAIFSGGTGSPAISSAMDYAAAALMFGMGSTTAANVMLTAAGGSAAWADPAVAATAALNSASATPFFAQLG